MKRIKLAIGNVNRRKISVLVDNEDFELLSKYSWYSDSHGYAITSKKPNGKRIRILMHRFIMSPSKGMEVDHKDRNRLNNQKSNLRICTVTQNRRNIGRNKVNKSGYKGVSWHINTNMWETRINFNNHKLFIGYFKSKRHAALAYDLWAKELHGEFAGLNFPLHI